MQWKNLSTTEEPNAACAATTDFGLRRESRRAGATPLLAAIGSTVKRCRRCALSPQSIFFAAVRADKAKGLPARPLILSVFIRVHPWFN